MIRLRAPEGVYELIDLLKLAHGAVNRARIELDGEASSLAARLSSQLGYLRGVSELLEHEATRSGTSTSPTEVKSPQLASAAVLAGGGWLEDRE
jgi:hypothetical protein